MATRSGKRTLGVLTALPFLALLGLVLYVQVARFDRRDAPPRLATHVFATTRPATPAVFYITEEERSRFEPEFRHSRWRSFRTIRYSVFDLCRAAVADKSDPLRVRIAKIDNYLHGTGPAILGVSGDVLWVWNGKLEGYATTTLDRTWSDEKLRAANPQTASLLPNDPKYYKVMAALDAALIFKGTDAGWYRIDNPTGRIEPLDPAPLTALDSFKRTEMAFHEAAVAGAPLGVLGISNYLWNSLNHGDSWYALLGDDRAAQLTGRSNLGGYPVTDTAASLYRVPYTLNKFADPILDVPRREKLGTARYITGGFVCRPDPDRRKRHLFRDGGDALAAHWAAVGKDAPMRLTRLRLTDGSAAWTADIPISRLDGVNTTGDTIVLEGASRDVKKPTDHLSSIVLVDFPSGATRVIDVSAMPEKK